MIKNDYRRSLIMLRVHAQGYSGHVRLERRTLMGNLYIVINVPGGDGVLCASLIRPDGRGGYTAVKIGELRRDGRGQASLAYSFDPRNIDGRTLEDYRLIAIVSRDRNGRCGVVLSGNVNGSYEIDWAAAQAAACAACRAERPPLCTICPPDNQPAAPGEGPLGPQTPAVPPSGQPAAPGEGPLGSQTPVVPSPGQPAAPGEGPLGPQTPALPSPGQPAAPGEGPLGSQTPIVPPTGQPAAPGEGPLGPQTPAVPPTGQPAAPGEGPLGSQTPDISGVIDEEQVTPAFDLPQEPVETVFVQQRMTAAEELGLDASTPWPGVTEQVRQYFASQPARELMLGDGYTYVTAPMPGGSGFENVEVGLRVQQGIPVAMAYALPSRYTKEPPQGLENYVWKGGAAEGWWVIETDPYTGEKL